MPPVLNFYIDDSGSRKPDRRAAVFDVATPNFFALGGVLVREDDEAEVRASHRALCEKWRIQYPLHSVNIRHGTGDFAWLKKGSKDYEPFMRDLTRALTTIPVTGLACVIDRPGYDVRYRKKYGRGQWRLCQTAFSILVERAAKYARKSGSRLRVLPERSNKDDERRLERYYESLRSCGCPFDQYSSGVYAPLNAAQCQETLLELRFKYKASPGIQIADLYLWPIAMERYKPGGRAYAACKAAGRLIEASLTPAEANAMGTKYSCFELVDAAARAAGR